MRLTLASSAAPDAHLDELVRACRRKGLDGLELVDGDGHGVRLDAEASRTRASADARAGGVVLTSFRLADADALPDVPTGSVHGASPPLLVPLVAGARLQDLRRAAAAFAGAHRPLVVSSPDAALLAEAATAAPSVEVAWDFLPGATDPGDVDDLLRTVGRRLTHVRLFGGGPESVGQGGTGIGRMVAGLAQRGFPGALVITPSSLHYRIAWSTWLGRRGGWGCSGKATPAEPIALHRSPA